MSRKVLVSEERQEVTAPLSSGMTKVLGYLISRIYQGEDVRRHSFQSVDDTGKQVREYSLGATTDKFEFTNHTEAIEPFLDQGYKIKRQTFGRGGMQLLTILEPKAPITYPDPITWDHSVWKADDSPLTETIHISSSVKPGSGFSFDRGFFRPICTNGLVARVLGLGSASFNHTNFAISTAMSRLGVGSSVPNVMGPAIGNKKGLTRFLDLMERVASSDESLRDELSMYTYKDMGPLLDAPKWWTTLFIQQVQLYLKWGPIKVHALDILNMVTSPISIARAANNQQAAPAEFRAQHRASSQTEAVSRLVGVLSL